jgi:hypothetical protein
MLALISLFGKLRPYGEKTVYPKDSQQMIITNDPKKKWKPEKETSLFPIRQDQYDEEGGPIP